VIDWLIKARGTEVGQAILLSLEQAPDLALRLTRNDRVMNVRDIVPPKPPASRPWWKLRANGIRLAGDENTVGQPRIGRPCALRSDRPKRRTIALRASVCRTETLNDPRFQTAAWARRTSD
jgi:hypothetical protein